MRLRVVYSREARADLHELFNYIAEQSGAERAAGYTRRITAYCRKLEVFPERGSRRDDLWPGLRLIGFEGRVTIAFQVTAGEVRIVRVLYGGRELKPALFEGA